MKWIKQREEDHGLVVKTFSDDYIKHLELAIQYGKPFLFEAVETDMDPSIDPVLERSLIIQNGQKLIMLGEAALDVLLLTFEVRDLPSSLGLTQMSLKRQFYSLLCFLQWESRLTGMMGSAFI